MVFHMNAIDLSPIAEAVCETLGRWLSADPRDVTLGLRTIAVGSVCNVSCAVLGCYLVLRGMSGGGGGWRLGPGGRRVGGGWWAAG